MGRRNTNMLGREDKGKKNLKGRGGEIIERNGKVFISTPERSFI